MDYQSLILDQAFAIRAFEQQMLRVYSTGQVRGTVHTCVGQELLPAAVCHFSGDKDWIFGGHRAHGYYLAKTGDYAGLAAEIFGKEGATSQGIGGSQHLHSDRFFTNGIQAGMMPIAAGVADTLNTDSIAISVIGDGTLGEGLVYESFNFASIHNLPLLTIIEDNEIAQSTPQFAFLAGSIEQRAAAFEITYFAADSHDLKETLSRTEEAMNYVRSSRKPAVLHVKSYRLNSHSKGDDNRSNEHIEELSNSDLLNKLMRSNPGFEARYAFHESEMLKISEEVLKREPAAGHVLDYASQVETITSQKTIDEDSVFLSGSKRAQKRLSNVLDDYHESKFIGEDISSVPIPGGKAYSGAFGVSGELSVSYPQRVISTPISESFIAGFGIGRGLAGSPTVVEVMFGDFSTLIVDQVRQQASKIPSMYGRRIELPVLYRLPMGGRRGYGPTHSQNFEGMFFGIPNTVVVAENNYNNDPDLYSKLLSLGLTTIAIESKDGYPSKTSATTIPGYTEAKKPDSKLSSPWIISPIRKKPFITIVTYGNASRLVEEAVEKLAFEYEIFVEILIFDIISPLDCSQLIQSVQSTGKILLIEESIPSQGLSSVLISEYSKKKNTPPIIYAIGGNGDIGASLSSESHAFVSTAQIVDFVTNLRN